MMTQSRGASVRKLNAIVVIVYNCHRRPRNDPSLQSLLQTEQGRISECIVKRE
jgi:hypothetical protein